MKPIYRDLRLEKGDEKSAAFIGTIMVESVRATAKEKAQALLDQEKRVTLSMRDLAEIAALQLSRVHETVSRS